MGAKRAVFARVYSVNYRWSLIEVRAMPGPAAHGRTFPVTNSRVLRGGSRQRRRQPALSVHLGRAQPWASPGVARS